MRRSQKEQDEKHHEDEDCDDEESLPAAGYPAVKRDIEEGEDQDVDMAGGI